MEKRISFLYAALALLAAPAVSAQLDEAMITVLETTGIIIQNIFQNEYILYAVSFVLVFALVFGLISTLTKRLAIFSHEQELSRPGVMFAFSFSALATLSLFYFTKEWSIAEILDYVFTPFGYLGASILPLLVFFLVYSGFKSQLENKHRATPLAMIAAGIASMFGGSIITSPTLSSFGILLLIIGFIWLIFSGEGGGAHK